MPITHVELELAPGPTRPFGDGDHVYDLYLPMLADGRIDRSRLGCCDGHCRFRAGDLLPIGEDGEAPGLFQVAWTREE